MKKALSLIIVLALCLGLCACGTEFRTEYGSQFVGKYEYKGMITEHYSSYGYNNLVHDISYTETMTLESPGIGTFKATATNSGEHYQVGDVIKEGTVKWMVEGEYITITFSGFMYKKDYGKNTTEQIDYTSTYEKKAGTLHNASSGYLEYTKVG